MTQHVPGNQTPKARDASRRIQQRLRAFAPDKGFVSDELIAERRAEEQKESRTGLQISQSRDD